MTKDLSIQEMWDSAQPGEHEFRAADLSHLPDAARRYLEHVIAPGTRLAHAVRLRMHGEIKLGRWHPFTAEQVIVWERGFIWSATVRMFGMPVRGSDRFVDGAGAMRWKLFGLIPIVTASGPDIDRSAAGRISSEAVWLPSVLCGDDVSWTAPDPSRLHARFGAHGAAVDLELGVGERGQIESVQLSRWGNPEGAEFHYVPFGAVIEEEKTFDGYTIPTRARVGWHFGTDRFEPEGEFFRAVIDEAVFR